MTLTDNDTKKKLRAQYKDTDAVGGVYLIRNTVNNKILLDAAADLKSRKNRFEFSQKTGSCVEMKLQKDWATYGRQQFVLEVLEVLEKGKTQTHEEFKADIGFLKEIWLDKLSNEEFY